MRRREIGGYFLRLGVGAMTALVIFIVAKAGVPVIADASRLGGDASINPYFVSFIAIISGLLSENAIANIQAQGARIFGGVGGNVDRWIRQDVSSDLAAQNLTLPGLASHLGHDETSVDKMLKGKEKDRRQRTSSSSPSRCAAHRENCIPTSRRPDLTVGLRIETGRIGGPFLFTQL